MDIKEYIKNCTIVAIGECLPDSLCPEVIVENPKELVEMAFCCKCFIEEIFWWDRVSISDKSEIGHGGPRDPRDSDCFYFAETDLSRKFNELCPKNDYLEYIDLVYRSFPQYDLYPSFDIRRMNC